MRTLAELDAAIAALKAERIDVLRAAWARPGSIKQIAHEVGINEASLRVIALRHDFGPRPRANGWTEGRLTNLKVCWLDGTPRAEIARTFKTSEGRISQIVAQNRWPRREPGRRAAQVSP